MGFKSSVFFLTIVFFPVSELWANAQQEIKINEKKEIEQGTIAKKIPDRVIMQDVFKNFTSLISYISDPETFVDPKNEQKIYTHLLNVSMAFQNVTHGGMLESKGFKPSLKTMQEHLKGTTEAFHSNHKNFALSRLRASTTMCISCHSQLPKNKAVSFGAFINTVNAKSFKTKFEYAEYLFIVRSYDKALKTYEEAIDQTIFKGKLLAKADRNLFQVQGPLTRNISEAVNQILQITLKIEQNPKKAMALLQGILKKSGLPKFISHDIENHLKQLDLLQKVTLRAPNNDSELEEFIKKNLEGHQVSEMPGVVDLKILQVSGILQQYLNSHFDTSDVPLIFYWLSFAERQLSRTFFFGLGDIYLKECIRSNPKHPFAKKCFEEYEDQLNYGYTGSAGTFIPDEEKKELAELKALIK